MRLPRVAIPRTAVAIPMRNPRAFLETPQLVLQRFAARTPPPLNSLFWTLWSQSSDIASKALQTSFIQGIASGTLDPVTYGRYHVSDAYYCFHAADDYLLAAARATDPVLKTYLAAKHASYMAYNNTFPAMWHLRDAQGIEPGEACRAYSRFERDLVRSEMPVYVLVAMLPCEHLWAWIGRRIGPPKKGNLYARWIEENSDMGGAFAIGNVLDEFEQRRPGVLCRDKSMRIYRRAMAYEWMNFETA